MNKKEFRSLGVGDKLIDNKQREGVCFEIISIEFEFDEGKTFKLKRTQESEIELDSKDVSNWFDVKR